ncbi:MAG TPA: hypothetical protein VGI82_07000 [Chitinophagaceae bacterium]|jgi:hypothetical protein
MNDRKHIGQEVEKTLNSLDGAKRATANPFLLTRIKAALQKDEKGFWSKSLTFVGRPAFAFTTILVAILVNAVLFLEFKSEPSQQSSDGEQLFANEYNLANNTIYDSTVEPE